MPDYQKSKIYKLWSPSKNLIYYGSTTETTSRRLSKHLTDYNRYNNKTTTRYVNSFKILECPDYKIELVEDYPCNNRQQLCKKEGEYIKANECVNKCVAGRTAEEYCEDNADKINTRRRIWREKNADKVNERHKKWCDENIDKVKENAKKWRADNADKKKEMDKKYRDDNIDKINERRKQYRETNADKIKERNKIYRDANADKIKERRRQKYLKQKEVKIEIIENV
jgi:hypothetical protein